MTVHAVATDLSDGRGIARPAGVADSHDENVIVITQRVFVALARPLRAGLALRI